jgi:hypothetical protein
MFKHGLSHAMMQQLFALMSSWGEKFESLWQNATPDVTLILASSVA